MKEKILSYLTSQGIGKTPTEIGMALGKTYSAASSSVNNPLKKLVEEKLVNKYKESGKILYKII